MRLIITTFFVFLFAQLYAINESAISPPHEKLPVEISVNVYFNKILNINTIDESYQIDGYLELSWDDDRVISDKKIEKSLIYENDKANELMDNVLWFPSFEMINIQGKREINNLNIEIKPSGKIIYTERFFGTFNSDMNYKKFPFDKQDFKIILEPFSYISKTVIFKNPKVYPEFEESNTLFEKWLVNKIEPRIEESVYEEFAEIGYIDNTYSRVVFEIKATRLSGFFIWQVLFPLMIIIFSSFLVFWIRDFSNQIGIGFTLMLTVVAFNFYSASILPELPYNTFIETTIMVGYSFIFLSIIAVILNNRINVNRNKDNEIKLLRLFRYLFPILYTVTMLIICFKYYYI